MAASGVFHLQEDDLVLVLGVGVQLVAPPLQLAQFVLQTPSHLLSVPLGLPLPSGNQLHQLCLTLLHQALQLSVHLPTLLQLPLSTGLEDRENKG